MWARCWVLAAVAALACMAAASARATVAGAWRLDEQFAGCALDRGSVDECVGSVSSGGLISVVASR
jgi:hypothetical protein